MHDLHSKPQKIFLTAIRANPAPRDCKPLKGVELWLYSKKIAKLAKIPNRTLDKHHLAIYCTRDKQQNLQKSRIGRDYGDTTAILSQRVDSQTA